MREMYQSIYVATQTSAEEEDSGLLDEKNAGDYHAAGRQLLVWTLAAQRLPPAEVLRGYYARSSEKYIGMYYSLLSLLEKPLQVALLEYTWEEPPRTSEAEAEPIFSYFEEMLSGVLQMKNGLARVKQFLVGFYNWCNTKVGGNSLSVGTAYVKPFPAGPFAVHLPPAFPSD